jgi:hypothetical protein
MTQKEIILEQMDHVMIKPDSLLLQIMQLMD